MLVNAEAVEAVPVMLAGTCFDQDPMVAPNFAFSVMIGLDELMLRYILIDAKHTQDACCCGEWHSSHICDS